MNFLTDKDKPFRWAWKELDKAGLTGMIDFARETRILSAISKFMYSQTERYNTYDN